MGCVLDCVNWCSDVWGLKVVTCRMTSANDMASSMPGMEPVRSERMLDDSPIASSSPCSGFGSISCRGAKVKWMVCLMARNGLGQ